MAEEKLRVHFGDYLGKAEVVIYSVLAVLLFITALATIANASKMLGEGLRHWTIATETLLVLDQLLAFSGYRTIPCRGPVCLDSARPCDCLGSGHPHKRWNVVERECEHISS